MAGPGRRVYGVELIEDAVRDANYNATLNGLQDSVSFICKRVEHAITPLLKDVTNRAVAVLDPPRSGVPNDVIRAVRNCEYITRVVYVACDAQKAETNFVECAFLFSFYCFFVRDWLTSGRLFLCVAVR